MSRQGTSITLSDADRALLTARIRSQTGEKRHAFRAQIVLMAADGRTNVEIASALRTRTATASRWRTRFANGGVEGLIDKPRPGKIPVYGAETEQRVLKKLDEPPPEGWAKWNGRLIAEALGDVSDAQVWRILRARGISLEKRRSWCVSTDPEFAKKAADVVGLYLSPPDNAVVLSVDEKPSIQALERAQGYLKLPNGKALMGYSHDYKRHGTTTLFAALNVATGQVKAGHYARRRRCEFLDFMNQVIAEHPDREIHVILDNLNTHKPKHDHWLAMHPNVHFHFIPTHSSWLNQVEVWFSILSCGALKGASFTSPQQVRDAIDLFIKVHNKTAAPFHWTKKEVGPKAIKIKYGFQCK